MLQIGDRAPQVTLPLATDLWTTTTFPVEGRWHLLVFLRHHW